MAIITCLVNLDDPVLAIDQPAPIIIAEHNITTLQFVRQLDEYVEGQTVMPTPTLIFESPKKEQFTFTPKNYAVTAHTEVIDEDEGEEDVDTTETTGDGTSEDDTPLTEGVADDQTGTDDTEPTEPPTPTTVTYWEETFSFDLPRILTEWPGVLTLALCYIWRDTITDEHGVSHVIIAKEWNSLPAALTISDTLHTYEVINRLDPSYVLEYDETGTIAYLT